MTLFERKPLQNGIVSLLASLFIFVMGASFAHAEDEFSPAYENESSYTDIHDPKKYIAYDSGRKYYTSGKKDGFRVNENNEESTDETVGIVTFILAPATIIFMNFIGWWD